VPMRAKLQLRGEDDHVYAMGDKSATAPFSGHFNSYFTKSARLSECRACLANQGTSSSTSERLAWRWFCLPSWEDGGEIPVLGDVAVLRCCSVDALRAKWGRVGAQRGLENPSGLITCLMSACWRSLVGCKLATSRGNSFFS